MYDFSFGDKKNIKKNPEEYLLFVKRLLPRWANGIPDTECLAIYKILEILRNKNKNKKLVLLETGSGASSIAMFLHCALYGGKMFSWDTNASKGSFLRTVVSESIGKTLGVDPNKIWNFIPYNSTDKHIGISVLKELKQKANFCFFDSLHTYDHVLSELKDFLKVCDKKYALAFDDAYYTKKSVNYSYINMLRSKLNLKEIKEPKTNIIQAYYKEIEKYLFTKKIKYKKVENFYKKNYKKDIFFQYYSQDRKFMNKMKMEEKSKLAHRLEVFLIN